MIPRKTENKSLPSLKIIQTSCILNKQLSSVSRLKRIQFTSQSSSQKKKLQQKYSSFKSKDKIKISFNQQVDQNVSSQQKKQKQQELIERKHQNHLQRITFCCCKLLENIKIFKKIFQSSQKKKNIIKKIYGWDQNWQAVLFEREEFKCDLTSEKIINNLGLSNNNLHTKAIYQRLRFFVTEFEEFNQKQTDIQTKFFKNRLQTNLKKLQCNFNKINNNKKSNLQQYVAKMIESHNKISTKKSKIINQVDFVQSLISQKVQLKIDSYCMSTQKNIRMIEKFIL